MQFGRTPLFWAYTVDAVNTLIKAKSDVNLRDRVMGVTVYQDRVMGVKIYTLGLGFRV